MALECKYLSSIHGIILDDDSLEMPLGVYDLKIGNKDTFIKSFFIPEVVLITGKSQFDNSLNRKSFLYTEFSTEEDLKGNLTLAYLLKISKHLSNALWLIKDNSVRYQTGHFSVINGYVLTVDSNVINGFYSNCFGEKNDIKFTKEEIELSLRFFRLFFDLTRKDEELKKIESTHAEVDRLHRAYYFLDLARTHFDIGTKVSLYCSAFECLFSVATTELKHRLSETIANFIGEDSKTKREYYDKMKDIYDLRSSVTHGSGIKRKLISNDAKLLKEIGYNCDDILRKCMFKICTTQEIFDIYMENKNEAFSEYFTDLIFK